MECHHNIIIFSIGIHFIPFSCSTSSRALLVEYLYLLWNCNKGNPCLFVVPHRKRIQLSSHADIYLVSPQGKLLITYKRVNTAIFATLLLLVMGWSSVQHNMCIIMLSCRSQDSEQDNWMWIINRLNCFCGLPAVSSSVALRTDYIVINVLMSNLDSIGCKD